MLRFSLGKIKMDKAANEEVLKALDEEPMSGKLRETRLQ